jgi:hypothetical protein
VTPGTFAILSPPCPRRSPSGRYSRRMPESRGIISRWRITETDNWDQEAVDLVKPGFIEFDEDGLGELGFIAVAGELDCRDADRDGRPGVEFSWQGSEGRRRERSRLGRAQPRWHARGSHLLPPRR